ncbi:MAG: CehA/McbA family metallohydrolase [Bryobacterales bacterium]|nr:CehA/McbA family metallohydrolase [Bryobacterales bacterium]
MKFAALLPALALASALMAQNPWKNATPPYPHARTGGNYMQNYYLPPAASTPWRPAFSPDGEWIVFSMAGSIWKIRIGETTAYELTAGSTYDSSPVFSPDGSKIVYTADEDYEAINLRMLDLKTGESHALTQGSQVNLDPVFAPDGKRLLYVSTQPDGWYNLYAMPLDAAGNPGQPLKLTADHSYHNARLYFGAEDLHIQPTISPSGDEMILVSNRDISLGSGGVWRAPVEPNAMDKAKLILPEETLYRTRPQWSPDGKRILYSSHRGTQFDNLYVLPVNGGEPYQLTFGDWDHFEPSWSPDGEWIVYVANEHGLSELRLLETFGGEERPIEIRQRVYKRPMGTLAVTVRDGRAGPLTAAKIMLTAADGKAYAPSDAYHRVGARALFLDFFHTDGSFELDLPVGEVELLAMKGFERVPVKARPKIVEGQVTRVELAVERFTNAKARGWYSGSDHVHMNYGGNLHNTPENLMFMAAAEDLDVVGEKVANKDNRIFDYQFYNGAYDEQRSTSDRLLSWGEEYRPPWYGHINFINLTDHLLSPFTTGYENTAIESLYPSNTDMFRRARKQGALGGHVHPYTDPPETVGYANARTFPVDLALGSFEYLEVMTGAMYAKHTARVWHRALNCGFRVTPSGGEDSISNLHRNPAIGAARVYADLGGKLEWSRWLDAIREGRTMITNGPLVWLKVDGEGPGGEIHLPESGGSVEVQATLESAFPVDRLELIFRGEVVQTIPLTDGRHQASWRGRVPVEQSGWFTLRALSDNAVYPIDDENLHAETAAVYVLKGDQPIRSREDAEYFITWIDAITKQAEQHPGWRSEKEKAHVLGQFADARKIMVERAAGR